MTDTIIHDIFRLAELQTEVELFRGAIYAAVNAMMAGQNVTLHASMIKLKLGRLSRYEPYDILASLSVTMMCAICYVLKGNSGFVSPILGRHGIH